MRKSDDEDESESEPQPPDPERAYRRYSSTIATRSKQNHRSGSSLLKLHTTRRKTTHNTTRTGRRGRPPEQKILRSLPRPEGFPGTRVVSPSSPSDDRRPLARWVHTRIRRRRGRLSAKWAPRPATRPWKRPSTTRPSTPARVPQSPPAGAPPSRWTPRRTPPCPPRRGIGGSTGGPSPPCCGTFPYCRQTPPSGTPPPDRPRRSCTVWDTGRGTRRTIARKNRR